VINALDESRSILIDLFDEFKREQDEYREQLENIMKSRETLTPRLKGKRHCQ
jgi:hypothetical protein